MMLALGTMPSAHMDGLVNQLQSHNADSTYQLVLMVLLTQPPCDAPGSSFSLLAT